MGFFERFRQLSAGKEKTALRETPNQVTQCAKIIAEAQADKRRAIGQILSNSNIPLDENQLEEQWLRGFYPNHGCTFDGKLTADSVRLERIARRITVDRSRTPPRYFASAEEIRNRFLGCIEHAMQLYGDIPIDHHIGVEVDDSSNACEVGASVERGRLTEHDSGELWLFFGSEDQRMRTSNYRRLRLTNPRNYQNTEQVVSFLDHETGHIAAGTMQPEVFPLREALAEAHRLVVSRERSCRDAKHWANDIAMELLPVEVLASEAEGGWGVPEGEHLEHDAAVISALYRSFLCDLVASLGGDIQHACYMFQAMVSHWKTKNAIWQDLRTDYTAYSPKFDQWLTGMDKVLESRGVLGFSGKYRERVAHTIPPGKRIVWVPHSFGGEILCLECKDSEQKKFEQMRAADKSQVSCIPNDATIMDSQVNAVFAEYGDGGRDGVSDAVFEEIGNDIDDMFAAPSSSGSNRRPWATIEQSPMKISIEVSSDGKDWSPLREYDSADRLMVSILLLFNKKEKRLHAKPCDLRIHVESGALNAMKLLRWNPLQGKFSGAD